MTQQSIYHLATLILDELNATTPREGQNASRSTEQFSVYFRDDEIWTAYQMAVAAYHGNRIAIARN